MRRILWVLVALIGGLVMATGGWSSPLSGLLLLPLLAAVVVNGPRGWAIDAVIVTAAAASPAVYDGVTVGAMLELAAVLSVWLVAALVMSRILGRLGSRSTELQRAYAYRDAFLRSAAHELRTPLTVISTGVATVREHAGQMPAEHLDRTLDAVDRNVRRLVAHVEDLTELDRLMRRVDQPRTDITSISDLVLDVAGRVDFNEHRMDLDVAHDVWAEVDGPRLRRAVEEIVSNAVRHTGPNTLVGIHLRPIEDRVELIVQDNGAGMPEELSRRALDPFVQGAASQRDASPGLGIGLALAAEIVRQQGGEVQITSGATGTRVTVTLPRAAVDRSGQH